MDVLNAFLLRLDGSTKAQLVEECRERGLAATGAKKDLLARLFGCGEQANDGDDENFEDCNGSVGGASHFDERSVRYHRNNKTWENDKKTPLLTQIYRKMQVLFTEAVNQRRRRIEATTTIMAMLGCHR